MKPAPIMKYRAPGERESSRAPVAHHELPDSLQEVSSQPLAFSLEKQQQRRRPSIRTSFPSSAVPSVATFCFKIGAAPCDGAPLSRGRKNTSHGLGSTHFTCMFYGSGTFSVLSNIELEMTDEYMDFCLNVSYGFIFTFFCSPKLQHPALINGSVKLKDDAPPTYGLNRHFGHWALQPVNYIL